FDEVRHLIEQRLVFIDPAPDSLRRLHHLSADFASALVNIDKHPSLSLEYVDVVVGSRKLDGSTHQGAMSIRHPSRSQSLNTKGDDFGSVQRDEPAYRPGKAQRPIAPSHRLGKLKIINRIG